MKALRTIAALLVVIAISVAAGASDGPSKRVINLQTLYSYLVSPNNQQVFPSSGVSPVDALFSTPTQGRIAPLGEGHDLPTVKKYFFGLPLYLQSLYSVTVVTFRSITEQPPIVIVEVDVSFTPTTLGQDVGAQPLLLRETGQFTFDKMFHIVSFDLSIPYLDTAMLDEATLNPSNPTFVSSEIENICQATMTSCTGQNAQYPDFASCVNALSAIPAGIFNRLSSNTVMCRSFHTPLLAIDPTGECPNVGSAGGSQCVDAPYNNYFSETF